MKTIKATVKWFNNAKGYGWLSTMEEMPRDVFVHYTEIQGEGFKTLSDGQTVECWVLETELGPWAREVAKLSDSSF